MKPAPFEYYIPDSLEQALDLMSQHTGEGKILAGGQSLVPAMNFRVTQPGVLIDLNRASELSYIREDGNSIRVGAMTRERHLEFDPLVSKRMPLLSGGSSVYRPSANPEPRNDWREHCQCRSCRRIAGVDAGVECPAQSKKHFG